MRAGRDRLHGGSAEPIDNRSADYEAEEVLRREEAEAGLEGLRSQLVLKHHYNGENHRRRAYDGGPYKNGLCSGLEGVAGPVVLLKVILGPVELRRESEIPLYLLLDVGHVLYEGKLIDGLGIVGDRPVAVDRNGDRPHTEKPEGHESEGEYRIVRAEEGLKAHCADPPGDPHKYRYGAAHPESAEIAGHHSGENVEGGPAFPRGVHHLLHMLGGRTGEHLGKLGNYGGRQGSAAYNRGQLQPKPLILVVSQHNQAGYEGDGYGKPGRDPNKVRQGKLEIHVL